MKAFKCDRCHEFYTADTSIKINTARTTYWGVRVIVGGTTKGELDFCPKCKKSFQDWFTRLVDDPFLIEQRKEEEQ